MSLVIDKVVERTGRTVVNSSKSAEPIVFKVTAGSYELVRDVPALPADVAKVIRILSKDTLPALEDVVEKGRTAIGYDPEDPTARAVFEALATTFEDVAPSSLEIAAGAIAAGAAILAASSRAITGAGGYGWIIGLTNAGTPVYFYLEMAIGMKNAVTVPRKAPS